METQMQWGADTPTSAGKNRNTARRATADARVDALYASLKELVQPDFDARAWAASLISETAEMVPVTAGIHLVKAGIFGKKEYLKVKPIFNKSPLCLKTSKPTVSQAARHTGTLAAWNKRRMESKAAFVSGAPFPCQKGGMFPNARASEN